MQQEGQTNLKSKPAPKQRAGLGVTLGKIGGYFKSLDNYGESVGFEIEGQPRFSTYVGAFISLIVLFLTFGYAYKRFLVMIEF